MKNIVISALLKEIAPKHSDNFYCLNCLHSFRTKNKLECHERVCKKKYFFGIALKSQYLINFETNPPPPIINAVCKYLGKFLGTSFRVATLPICCNIE